MEENTQHFWHIMLDYFEKSKNTTEMQKKICAECGEGAVTDQTCQKLWSFMLEISRWTMLQVQVLQLKLIAIKLRHWEQSMLYHVGESQHIQNIQISKVICENEKCVFYFTEKNHTDILANPIAASYS